MLPVPTLLAHTTVLVCMDTLEMESTAQVMFSTTLMFTYSITSTFSGINLCEVGPTDCHTNATCLDRDGGYDCECNDGYNGNGTHCDGIP